MMLGKQDQEFRTGWHGDGHGEITEAGLPFVRKATLEELTNANEDTDGPVICEGQKGLKDCGPTKLKSAYHFDNCRVGDAFGSLRARYEEVVDKLAPEQPDFDGALKKFGTILHTSQDFYAHSNWVDSGRRGLVSERGFWPPSVSAGSLLDGMFVLAEPLPEGVTVSLDDDSRVPDVFDGKQHWPGLITGTYEGNEESSICPPEASIEHGDFNIRFWNDHGEYLAKDDPDSYLHDAAVDVATDQTSEEFCRLVRLVSLRHGKVARERLLAAWVEDRAGYDAMCPDDLGLVASLWMAAL
jgi:hypothetical protein